MELKPGSADFRYTLGPKYFLSDLLVDDIVVCM